MKKIQLIFVDGVSNNHAGSKAPKDISIIAQEMGFEKMHVSVAYKKTTGFFKLFCYLKSIYDWCRLFFKVPRNAIVLLQCPLAGGRARNFILQLMKQYKHIKYIALVHDVAMLRCKCACKEELSEFNLMLDISDVIIVHNKKMKQWFEEKGVCQEKLIAINIFDYLAKEKDKIVHFDKSVSFAGNLDLRKSGFLLDLEKLNSKFILYGPNYSEKIRGSNIAYKGSYHPDVLPRYLNRGFGLIWDGTAIDTCSGDCGNYLRYNNSHKLSLFIASGMPVFIWSEAALASFVVENKLGFVISTLKEIDEIFRVLNEKDYMQLVNNVNKFSVDLINGVNTRNALRAALNKLEDEMMSIK